MIRDTITARSWAAVRFLKVDLGTKRLIRRMWESAYAEGHCDGIDAARGLFELAGRTAPPDQRARDRDIGEERAT